MKNDPIKVNILKYKKKKEGQLDKLSFSHDLKVAAFQLLNSHDVNTRISAAYKLGHSRKEEVAEILHKALRLESNEFVLDEIISVIGILASNKSINELFEFLASSQSPKLRKKAVVILSFFPNSNIILEGVEALLLHEVDEGFRSEVVWLLGKIASPKSLKTLEKIIFFDPSFEVKKQAIQALLKLEDNESKKSILERALVEISNKELRRELLWHYSKIADYNESKLIKIFETENDLENQRLLVWLITRKKNPDIVTELIKSFDPNLHHQKVMREVNLKIVQLKSKLSQEHLLDILEFSPHSSTRQNAIEVLTTNLNKINLSRLVRIKEQETDENLKSELDSILRLI